MISENFAPLHNIAKRDIAKEKTQKHFQAVVIEYANGKTENFLLSRSDYFTGNKVLTAVRANADNTAKRIACMWDDGGGDFPCYELRASLYSLSEKTALRRFYFRTTKLLALKN